jgi:hypothetical protein
MLTDKRVFILNIHDISLSLFIYGVGNLYTALTNS